MASLWHVLRREPLDLIHGYRVGSPLLTSDYKLVANGVLCCIRTLEPFSPRTTIDIVVLSNNGALAEEVSGYERASPWQLPTSALHDYHGGVPTGSSLKSPYMMTEAQSLAVTTGQGKSPAGTLTDTMNMHGHVLGLCIDRALSSTGR
ncbi:hypothetical protein FCULG_00003780 [Fusarium culmorum]|uniref:Uncharacterized protein n=1 Tax=Fusarium culmorum TaxID=5516 RepID=A0A2T4HA05_FUSCU|nr:hypothetical protein FCULG_00003780 [Fusarium culmorum]